MAYKDNQHEKPCLTRRQTECLQLTANGMTAQAIASVLGISVRMVRWHLREARERLDAASSAQAVHFASKAGLLK